jgi:hypothetical protein
LYQKEEVRAVTERSAAYSSWIDIMETSCLKETNLPETGPNNDSKGRARFARGFKMRPQLSSLGYDLATGLSLYLAIIPLEVERYLWDLFTNIGLITATKDSAIQKLKEITLHAVKYGPITHPEVIETALGSFEMYRYLAFIETAKDYEPILQQYEALDGLKAWVQEPKKHYGFDGQYWSETQFDEDFRTGVREFFAKAPVSKFEPIGVEEYATSPHLWGRSGASTTKQTLRYEDPSGEIKNVRKTKWRYALGTSPGDIIDVLQKKELFQKPNLILKRERSKTRQVIQSDDETYTNMDYIMSYVEEVFQGHPCTTLFMNPKQLTDMWENMAKSSLRKISGVNQPTDIDKFDHQWGWPSFRIFFEEWERWALLRMKRGPKREEYIRVLRKVARSMERPHNVAYQREDGNTGYVRAIWGIESGLKITSFLDSAVNYGANKAIASSASRRVPLNVVTRGVIVQGDDLKQRLDSYGEAAVLAKTYEDCNIPVNVKKFFTDDQRDDFLRKLSSRGRVVGYPARSVGAILWRNPITREPVAGKLRVTEQYTSWNALLGRGADYGRWRKLMLRDISQGNGLSINEVEAVLRTPAAFGGLGAEIGPGGWMSLSEGKVEIPGTPILSDVKGLAFEEGYWRSKGVNLEDHDLIGAITPLFSYATVGSLIEKGSVVAIPRRIPTFHGRIAYSGFPLSGLMNQDHPTLLSSAALRRKIRDKDWDWIHDVYLDPGQRGLSRTIMTRVGRGIWLDWVEGRLPFAIPAIPIWMSLYVSQKIKSIYRGLWQKFIYKSHRNRETLKRAFFSGELIVREELRGLPFMVSE